MKYVDYKGTQLFSGDEYFIFENENGFEAVHCEDIKQYVIDNFNKELNYESCIMFLETIGVYSETYIERGEFK